NTPLAVPAPAGGLPPGGPRGSVAERASPPPSSLRSDETAAPVQCADGLLLVAEGCSHLETLRRALVRNGVHLCASEASSELSRHAARGSGVESAAVRAWAHRRFQVRFALAVQCAVTARSLADEPLGSPALQSAPGGVDVVKVDLALSRIDLRSGRRTASLVRSAEAFAVDRGTAIDKAFDQALLSVPASLKDAGSEE